MNYFEYMAEYIGPSTIDLSALGINVASLVLSGGGTVDYTDSETVEGYIKEMREKAPKYALMKLGVNVFRCTIAVLNDTAMGFFLISMQANKIITAKIYITTDGTSEVTVNAEVS